MKIVAIYYKSHSLQADGQIGSTIIKNISLGLCPEAVVGNYCLIHTNTALQIIDEEKANKIIQQMQTCGIA